MRWELVSWLRPMCDRKYFVLINRDFSQEEEDPYILSRRREQDVIELPNGARQLRRPVIQQQQEMIYGNCRNYSSNLYLDLLTDLLTDWNLLDNTRHRQTNR